MGFAPLPPIISLPALEEGFAVDNGDTNDLDTWDYLNVPSSSDQKDMASVQRYRRFRRVQIMKEKRLRIGRFSSSNLCAGAIEDPKLLRKLRNRESAARSRQRKDFLVDELTFRLCEYYVLIADLLSEQTCLLSLLSCRDYSETLHNVSGRVIIDDQCSVSDTPSCSSNCTPSWSAEESSVSSCHDSDSFCEPWEDFVGVDSQFNYCF